MYLPFTSFSCPRVSIYRQTAVLEKNNLKMFLFTNLALNQYDTLCIQSLMNQFTHLRASCNTVTASLYAVQFSFNDVHEAFKGF